MASLGKLSNSLVAVTNENTLALLNVNIDFAFVRCEPSPEYSPVGTALTVKRKQEAENGALHEIACKLGFLFHEMLPNTPKLLRAYGTRISQILSQPGINPEGTKDDGPFRDFVGADCTSIWAAATSGPASINMLFLACLLARAWDAKTATSIWVELIEERKKQVWAQVEDNKIVHPHSLAAARQDISRTGLSSWDASARAWLRRADTAMSSRVTQLQLIAKNLSIPYWSAGSTFERVMMNWTRSMEMLEKLLSNIPQEASTRAVLLAISSWHLYPDMLVFQDKARRIPFSDELFPSSGILSTGLEYKGPVDNVTQWSLSLSHLRFYGDSVVVRSDNSQADRVPACKLWVVALGIIFRRWNVSYSEFDEAVAWFDVLGTVLSRSNKAQCAQLSCIVQLCEAAASVRADGQLVDGGLIKYGWRRAKQFLGADTGAMPIPYFGLCNPYLMSSISMASKVDCGIEYLRGIASQLGLAVTDAVVSYTGSLGYGMSYIEWATIAPVEAHLGLRGSAVVESQGTSETTATAGAAATATTKTHVRWLHYYDESSGFGQSALEERRSLILRQGEHFHVDYDGKHKSNPSGTRYVWKKPPALFRATRSFELVCINPTEAVDSRFQLWVVSGKYNPRASNLWKEKVRTAANAVALEGAVPWLEQTAQPQKVAQYLLESLKYDDAYAPPSKICRPTRKKKQEALVDGRAQDTGVGRSHVLEATLSRGPTAQTDAENGNDDDDVNDITGYFQLMNCTRDSSIDWLMPLRMLELVTHVYKDFQAATVSLRVLDYNLQKAKWIHKVFENAGRYLNAAEWGVTAYLADMSLAATFSCIAMFESGYLDIDPEQMKQVLALCSEDSMFVAGIMLSDPSTTASNNTVRHLVGNVGHSGMIMMVSPIEPRVRGVGHSPDLVAHRPFDNNSKDSFCGTSLHLSFTSWKMPLDWKDTGAIDQSVYMVESVVSVQDNGKWVADIDVLGMFEKRPVIREVVCDKDDGHAATGRKTRGIVSIDTWEEFLDPPPCTAVFRALNNWAARLAAVCIFVQQSNAVSAVIIGGGGER